MRLLLAHNLVDRRDKARKKACPRNAAEMGTGGVHRAWSLRPQTTWKKLSCGANAESSNKPAWREAAISRLCSRLCAHKKKWDVMIRAPAVLAKNIRSATGPELPRMACDSLLCRRCEARLVVAFLNRFEHHLLRATPSFLLPLGK